MSTYSTLYTTTNRNKNNPKRLSTNLYSARKATLNSNHTAAKQFVNPKFQSKKPSQTKKPPKRKQQ